MSSVSIILSSLLPVAFVITLGYLSGRLNVFRPETGPLFSTLGLSYCLPSLLFITTATMTLAELHDWRFFLGLTLGLVIVYVLSISSSLTLLRKPLKDSSLNALSSSFPSMALVGIPILISVIGKIAVLSVAFGNLIMNVLMVPFTLMQLEGGNPIQPGKTRNQVATGALLQAAKQPLVWSPVAGLLFAFSGISMPVVVRQSFSLLGDATSGVALFATGLILSGQRFRINSSVAMNVLFKNIVQPAVMWLVAVLLGLTAMHRREMVLLGAVPMAIVPMMISVKYHIATEDTEASVLISTTLSMITMAIVIVITS